MPETRTPLTARVDAGVGAAPDGALQLLPGLLAAFNSHDADAFAAHFAMDAWFINVDGLRFSGRAGIAAAHRFAFSSILARTRLHFTETASRSVGEDVAMIEAAWASDDDDPAQPSRQGVMTLLLERGGQGDWSIVHCANGDYSGA